MEHNWMVEIYIPHTDEFVFKKELSTREKAFRTYYKEVTEIMDRFENSDKYVWYGYGSGEVQIRLLRWESMFNKWILESNFVSVVN